MMHMITVHQPSPVVPIPGPGTYVPNQMPPLDVPAETDTPPEVDEPQPLGPLFPVREPPHHTPLQSAASSG